MVPVTGARPRGTPPRAWLVVLLALALAAAAPLPAQGRPPAAPASPYVPLDDPLYRYLDALIARGALDGLPTLERPYTVSAVRAALAELDEHAHGRVVAGWARAASRALGRLDVRSDESDDDAPAMRVSLLAIGTGETSARRELMLADDRDGGHWGVGGRAALAAGPLVAASRIHLDQRLQGDPDFRGNTARSVSGRTEDAYLAGQWRYGSLFLGRLGRSWGPHAVDGLQLGPYAYSWDHVAGRLGTDRIHLTSVVARLDPYVAPADSLRWERHLSTHRLGVHLRGFELGLTEGVVYGGPGRGTELSYLNPLNLFQLAQYNEAGDGNVSYSADAAWRVDGLGVLAAQLLVDDLQIDRCAVGCKEPASLGWTIAVEGFPLWRDHRAFGSYTAVSNLTYRAPQPWEGWTTFDVGLGRGFSDYDELRAGIDLALLPWAPVRAYAAYRRQGEGDYRLPFPPESEYPATPAILAGRPERILRAGVSGALLFGSRLSVGADVGYNRVRDAGHVAGRRRDAVEGRIRATLEVGSPSFQP